MKYQKYEKYKDSGLKWVGLIPDTWLVKKLKFITSTNDEVLSENTDEDYEIKYVDIGSIDKTKGVTNKEELIFDDAPSRARRIVRDGDVIVSTVRTYLRAIAPIIEPEENLVVSTGFAVIRPRKISKEFLLYALQATNFVEKVVSLSVGVSYPAINSTTLKNIKIPFPPSNKQQQSIANYLDCETVRIDALIEKKQKLIDLLKEKRTALITKAVTKGLNPDVKMKDSGIEWLDEIPEHWEVKRIKHISRIFGRIGFRGYNVDDLVDEGQGAITLGAGHINKKDEVDISKPVFLSWDKYYESPEIMVKKDDVIFGQRGSVGKVAYIDKDYGKVTINPSIILLKRIKVIPKYLKYYLQCPIIRKRVDLIAQSTAVPMISQEQLSNFKCPVPNMEEQKNIVEYIDVQIKKIDTLINTVKKAIYNHSEFKTAIISAAVTGKIKVTE